MKKAIVMLAVPALLLIWNRSSSDESATAEPYGPPPPEPPRGELVQPGVYWTFVPWLRMAELIEYFDANPITVHGVYGEPSGVKNAMVVFEVHAPIRWTLPPAVRPAPKGIDTEPEDVFQTVPTTPAWRRWMEERAAATLDAVRDYDRQMQQWLNDQLR